MTGTPLSADTARQFAQAYLRDAGKVATDAQLADLAEAVHSGVRVDPESLGIMVANGDGSFAPADFHKTMDSWTAQLPRRPADTSTAPAAPARPGPSDPYAGRSDTFANLGRGLAAQRAAEAERLAKHAVSQGNPWLPGRINRTAQGLVANYDPELAARWKAEAGVNSAKYSWK
jgi:hypothetical protein